MIFERKSKKWQLIVKNIFLVFLIVLISYHIVLLFDLLSTKSYAKVEIDWVKYNSLESREKTIALTFDDGPDPTLTPQIIEVLKEYDIPATFFVTGSNALRYPGILKQLKAEGFGIGNHTFTHSNSAHKSKRRLALEINATKKILESVIDESFVYYRPPFLLDIGVGAAKKRGEIAEPLEWAYDLGYLPVGVDIDPADWQAESVELLEQRLDALLEEKKFGVILLHDSGTAIHTPSALKTIIPKLKNQGYTFVSLADVYGQDFASNVTGKTGIYNPLLALKSSFFYTTKFIDKIYFYVIAFSFGSYKFGIISFALVLLALFLVRLLFVTVLYFIDKFRRPKAFLKSKFPVSVIVPAFNEEENISATLQSILESEAEDFEVIVVDDGSTDETYKVVSELCKKYPEKMRVVQKNNGGKASALNVGLEAARHEIVVTIDGDTVFEKKTLTELVKHFSDPEIASVAGNVCTTKSKNLLNLLQFLEYTVSQNVDKKAFSLINAVGVVPGPIGAWRKSVVKAVGGYSTDTLVEDQDLTLKILNSGKKILFEPSARAYTETPFNTFDFFKQRFRWIFGSFQCMWKYKSHFFSPKNFSLGWIVLPHTLIFTLILPSLYLVVDSIFVISIFAGGTKQIVPFYLAMLALEYLYFLLGFSDEKTGHYSILLMPLQRIFYRFVMYFVILKSISRILQGTENSWNKVRKRGDAYSHHLNMLKQNL